VRRRKMITEVWPSADAATFTSLRAGVTPRRREVDRPRPIL